MIDLNLIGIGVCLAIGSALVIHMAIQHYLWQTSIQERLEELEEASSTDDARGADVTLDASEEGG